MENLKIFNSPLFLFPFSIALITGGIILNQVLFGEKRLKMKILWLSWIGLAVLVHAILQLIFDY